MGHFRGLREHTLEEGPHPEKVNLKAGAILASANSTWHNTFYYITWYIGRQFYPNQRRVGTEDRPYLSTAIPYSTFTPRFSSNTSLMWPQWMVPTHRSRGNYMQKWLAKLEVYSWSKVGCQGFCQHLSLLDPPYRQSPAWVSPVV